ncbi:hypothetical protein AM1_C0024 (plasmid) [Acaryochloris marina MBIC11017]|uniref:Uncharacterized protein n=1 Tax=Acaryochloris marina (strain MBIC 11017) TaxID=329726 RepID=A8ZMC3_ACAM1|nr:hypothetical protein AM1_C0024 [Acaryochloris marina MBIC11017]
MNGMITKLLILFDYWLPYLGEYGMQLPKYLYLNLMSVVLNKI